MLEHLTTSDFKSKVFDYEKNQEWKFEGTRPALVDFYADWCGPCKMVAPILEELSNEYGEKLNIYKVNTDEERELSAAFGIQSIPSLLFIPLEGQPQMAMGALPKESFKQAIKEVLKVE
jgi:thioredoxin 1